jgi:hypothetical protein
MNKARESLLDWMILSNNLRKYIKVEVNIGLRASINFKPLYRKQQKRILKALYVILIRKTKNKKCLN